MSLRPIRSLADIEAIEAAPYEENVEPRNIHDLFRLSAERYGNRTAITYLSSPDPDAPAEQYSYRDLLTGILKAANLFRSLGVAEDESVAFLLPNVPEAHFVLWGAEIAARACPINYLLQPDHIAELLDRAKARVLVALGPDPDLDIWTKVPAVLAKAPGVKHVLHVGAVPGPIQSAATWRKRWPGCPAIGLRSNARSAAIPSPPISIPAARRVLRSSPSTLTAIRSIRAGARGFSTN